MTSRPAPLPKLLVTCLSCTPVLPQLVQPASSEVDGNDVEATALTGFDNGFGGIAGERSPLDDVLDFTSGLVSLALDDLAREDDVFKIEDAEVVIFKFVRCVG
jgi:hypothetical protein